MGYFPIYADDQDHRSLLLLLNADPDIAFVTGDGPGRWIARRTLEEVGDGEYCVWHIPGGPLPLVGADGELCGTIEDPWSGWQEQRSGGEPFKPWFLDSPGQIWWTVRTRCPKDSTRIGISGFSWIGNYWRPVGRSADPQTERWWSRFRNAIKKLPSRRVTRVGPLDGPRPDVWALPSALAKLERGTERSPW